MGEDQGTTMSRAPIIHDIIRNSPKDAVGIGDSAESMAQRARGKGAHSAMKIIGLEDYQR